MMRESKTNEINETKKKWGTLRGIKSLDGVKWDPEPCSSMDEI